VITFFSLTITIYWIPDTTRRRVLHLTLILSLLLSGSSEVLQGVLDNDREFDGYDIIANIVGSLAAVGLCSWYHKRMLERRRKAKGYVVVAGDDQDLELGEGVGLSSSEGQERGIPKVTVTLEDGGRNWDDHGNDNWDVGSPPAATDATAADEVEADGKRVD